MIPLKIDKANADTKAPPGNPFMLQLAIKSSLDVYYCSVTCEIHALIGREPHQKLSKDDFKKYWDSLGQDKTYSLEFGGMSGQNLYQGFQSVSEDI